MKKTPIANQLKKEIAFFEGHPERWTQWMFARDANWREVTPTSSRAKCFCQSGNRRRIYGPSSLQLAEYDHVTSLVTAVAESMGYSGAIKLNDETDFSTVMEMLYVALEHAEGAGV